VDAEVVEPHALSRRTKLVILIALGSSILVLAVFPFLLMTIPDPHPYRLQTLAGEVSGTFVVAPDGYYKLYPYSAPLFSFPSDALVVPSALPTLLVKFRQANALGLFALTKYGAETIALAKKPVSDTTLELTPAQPLPPGEYVLTAPRDSVDEEIDNFYFRVSS
jgi:hypothetical protein